MLEPLERASPADLPELMDEPGCDAERLRGALAALARSNVLFGGHRLVWRGVRRALGGAEPGPLRILDVGTGAADIPLLLDRRLRAEGWSPRFVLADLHATTLRIARERIRERRRDAGRFRLVRLDGPALPFIDGAFDLVLCANTLHHLERGGAARLLSEAGRVAARGWVVSDLRRSRLALGLVRLLAATLWRREPFPRRDGPVSVRRAFTPPEMDGLMAEAGVGGSVLRTGPVRFLAAGGSGAGGGRASAGGSRAGRGRSAAGGRSAAAGGPT